MEMKHYNNVNTQVHILDGFEQTKINKVPDNKPEELHKSIIKIFG